MSIFGAIKDAIFGPKKAAPAATPSPSAAPAAAPVAAAPTPTVPAQPVDVAAILTEKAAAQGQNLNWQTSIVDLMKLLGLDSSHENRNELATELGYTGDKSDSASMNIWLHKQVMAKLAADGGKVPPELMH